MRSGKAIIISAVLSLPFMIPSWGHAKPQADEYYPSAETAERNTIVLPKLADLSAGGARLKWPQELPRMLAVGSQYQGWELVGTIPQPTPMAVLERSFAQWGVLVYIGPEGLVATMRKSIGSLESLHQDKSFPPESIAQVMGARHDVLGQQVLAHGEEPSYEALAGLLPPLRAYTFLGTPMSREKIIVWQDGRLGLGIHDHELSNILFDPVQLLHGPNGNSAATKQGLVGRYLPVIDYGFFDPGTKSGWEEMAFSTGEEELQTYVCLRSKGGRRTYWRLPGAHPLENGTAFYRKLLSIQQKWDKFFAEGTTLQVPEDRVLDASKAGIVRALISERGVHPKYGVGVYADAEHDTFPPTIVQLNLCLLDWGFTAEVKSRLGYYLSTYVKKDGTFDYYGPAISEYGQILTLAVRYVRLTGDTAFLAEHLPELKRIAGYLASGIEASRKEYSKDSPYYSLLYGAAEADTREDKKFYFSGDLWSWRGLKDFGQLLADEGSRSQDMALEQLGKAQVEEASEFQKSIFAALTRSIRSDTTPPFLPPVVGMSEPFQRMTENSFSSYTNYRYWLEMLSPGMLTPAMSKDIIDFRTDHGGEVAGTTRFEDALDDWTYANYAWALLEAAEPEHYLLGFYGHLAYHQTPGTFTAYESVAIKGDRTRTYSTDYCVPAEVVIPQMLRWMMVWEPWDKQELWLVPAVPNRWLEKGISARGVPTRWGLVSFEEKPADKGFTLHVELAASHPQLAVYIPLHFLAAGSAPRVTVEGTKTWELDTNRKAIRLGGSWKSVTVSVER
jgi:hypothetical protein